MASAPAAARDEVGLAALVGFHGGNLAGDHSGRGERILGLFVGMQVPPPVAVRGFALGDAGARVGGIGGIHLPVKVELSFKTEFEENRGDACIIGRMGSLFDESRQVALDFVSA
jgi:hypothetical protein